MSWLIVTQWIFPLALLGLAVMEDLKRRKVRNEFIIISFVFSLLLLIVSEGLQGLPVGLLSLVAAFGVGFPLYLLRIVGAGDVKLLMVLSLNLDWNAVITVGCASLVWGAFLGVFQILLKKQMGLLFQNLITVVKTRHALQAHELHHIPFTVALFLGWLTHMMMMKSGGALSMKLNRSGQVLIEAILIMAVFLAAGAFIAKQIRDKQMLAQLAVGPWSQLTGMIENGAWGGVQKTKPQHPNYLRRHISLKGQPE